MWSGSATRRVRAPASPAWRIESGRSHDARREVAGNGSRSGSPSALRMTASALRTRHGPAMRTVGRPVRASDPSEAPRLMSSPVRCPLRDRCPTPCCCHSCPRTGVGPSRPGPRCPIPARGPPSSPTSRASRRWPARRAARPARRRAHEPRGRLRVDVPRAPGRATSGDRRLTRAARRGGGVARRVGPARRAGSSEARPGRPGCRLSGPPRRCSSPWRASTTTSSPELARSSARSSPSVTRAGHPRGSGHKGPFPDVGRPLGRAVRRDGTPVRTNVAEPQRNDPGSPRCLIGDLARSRGISWEHGGLREIISDHRGSRRSIPDHKGARRIMTDHLRLNREALKPL